VRDAVDAVRAARYDRDVTLDEPGGEVGGDVFAVRAGGTGADDRARPFGHVDEPFGPERPQHHRRLSLRSRPSGRAAEGL
jgi:hypothetical protein